MSEEEIERMIEAALQKLVRERLQFRLKRNDSFDPNTRVVEVKLDNEVVDQFCFDVRQAPEYEG